MLLPVGVITREQVLQLLFSEKVIDCNYPDLKYKELQTMYVDLVLEFNRLKREVGRLQEENQQVTFHAQNVG